jgi:hypothetical protein
VTATPAQLKTLTASLIAIGITTPERRKAWIERIVDRKLTDAGSITDEDIRVCLSYLGTVEMARKIFPGARIRT